LTKLTRKHIKTLGATGAGVEKATDIDMLVSNDFTNKWSKQHSIQLKISRTHMSFTYVEEIEADFPWFFEMQELIVEQPNIITTGLGNSTSMISSPTTTPTYDFNNSAPATTASSHAVEDGNNYSLEEQKVQVTAHGELEDGLELLMTEQPMEVVVDEIKPPRPSSHNTRPLIMMAMIVRQPILIAGLRRSLESANSLKRPWTSSRSLQVQRNAHVRRSWRYRANRSKYSRQRFRQR